MAPAYKLIYFDARGAMEPTRFLLKYGEIEFEDIRVTLEDWPNVKETTPFGTLPVIEHNGKKINQSMAITRFAGKLVKLAGKDEWEDLEIDAVVDTLNDLLQKILPILREQDEEKKKVLKETALKETLPYYFSRLDNIAQKNKGHLGLSRLNWGDFWFAALAPIYDNLVGGSAYEKYPHLKALREEVEAIPAVKKWIEIRPKTEN